MLDGSAPTGEYVAEVILIGDRRYLAENVAVTGGLVTVIGHRSRRRQPVGPLVRRTFGPTEVLEIRWTETEDDL